GGGSGGRDRARGERGAARARRRGDRLGRGRAEIGRLWFLAGARLITVGPRLWGGTVSCARSQSWDWRLRLPSAPPARNARISSNSALSARSRTTTRRSGSRVAWAAAHGSVTSLP